METDMTFAIVISFRDDFKLGRFQILQPSARPCAPARLTGAVMTRRERDDRRHPRQ